MKKSLLIGLGVFVLIAIGVGIWAYMGASESAREQNQAQQAVDLPLADESASDSPARVGTFVDYEDGSIERTPGTKILFFHAPWCPQCRMIEADIKAQASLPENTTIFKVDYDSHQDLRQRYGVTLQTTFVRVDNSGTLLKKYVAYNEPNYESVRKNLLD